MSRPLHLLIALHLLLIRAKKTNSTTCASGLAGDTSVPGCQESACADATACAFCRCRLCPTCSSRKSIKSSKSSKSTSSGGGTRGDDGHHHHSKSSASSSAGTSSSETLPDHIVGSASKTSNSDSSSSSHHHHHKSSSSSTAVAPSTSSGGSAPASKSSTDSHHHHNSKSSTSSNASPSTSSGARAPASKSNTDSHHHHHKSSTSSNALAAYASSGASASTGTSQHHHSRGSAGTGDVTSPAGARFDAYCATATCDRFCKSEFKSHHCHDCKCKGCSFCASYKCEKVHPPPSLPRPKSLTSRRTRLTQPLTRMLRLHAVLRRLVWQPACESFCDLEFKKHHCPNCKCRACKFCKPPPKPPPPPPPPSPSPHPPHPPPPPSPSPNPPSPSPLPPAAPRCAKRFADDDDREKCTPVFCRFRTRTDDCQYCKCRACEFCVDVPVASPPSVQPAATRTFPSYTKQPPPPQPTALSAPVRSASGARAAVGTGSAEIIPSPPPTPPAPKLLSRAELLKEVARLHGETNGAPIGDGGLVVLALLLALLFACWRFYRELHAECSRLR
jgi:hypothetical protein